MVENRPWLTAFTHLALIIGIIIMFFPIYLAFVASTHTLAEIMSAPMPLLPGSHFVENYSRAFLEGSQSLGAPVSVMMKNSLIMALGIALGKIAISLLAAFAIVYFQFRFRMFFFWTIFLTLMLPVEVRILPTYKVVSDLGLLNSYTGLTLPLIASATATFLFRQFFMAVPDELAEAARVDGAGPLRFFIDILVPMSRTSIAAMFVILFIYGWNQYLWPLLITTEERYYTLLIGINRMLAVGDQQAEWHIIMATTLLAMTPPVLVVVFMQRLFVRGMTETEK
ncbi:sn-glycerol-3-phosphate ABC transporter permease UgpE [candidate division KSB3 bacterium]|uniref:Sn-glycerol-3-phosphate ABC transporter permease UgpE n=1 Tax=candidate division KSB3 bacterium TaxID=2044937 RepID=A0A9D5JSW5_9BACT|nr:sn-glycerol-3-phosphate ABC transporter permease UgpE [candidate division KSB3 bacterium]MBD3323643.1 sn-glycerol-3-phosphate ABC transporter permease UgpE [candidate division KSB3 bacterium]